MARNPHTDQAREIMLAFAERTGLTGSDAPRRYLWTDAFAVCTFCSLHAETDDAAFLDLARRLIVQVHEVLGKHRPDDGRSGWISGLGDVDAARHPTAGGLRIGKGLPERRPDQPIDPQREWDRDGQYFHYLTKWMHALRQARAATGDPDYLRWAVELAKAAHAGFSRVMPAGAGRSLCWKMSIDLSRPLVASTGLHDPLDALVTYMELEYASGSGAIEGLPSLRGEIEDALAMCQGRNWTTDDPLGLGGLLFDAFRLAQMQVRDVSTGGLLATLLRSAFDGVTEFMQRGTLHDPAEFRLAFRELGLSIGLHGLVSTARILEEEPTRFADLPVLQPPVAGLRRHAAVCGDIEGFWCSGNNQARRSWRDHEDINAVMLATSLSPQGFLNLDDGRWRSGPRRPSSADII